MIDGVSMPSSQKKEYKYEQHQLTNKLDFLFIKKRKAIQLTISVFTGKKCIFPIIYERRNSDMKRQDCLGFLCFKRNIHKGQCGDRTLR